MLDLRQKEVAMTTVNVLAKLVSGFQATMQRMAGVVRWGHYHTRTYKQTSLDHSLSLAVLTAYCLHREEEIGIQGLDHGKVITHAAVHDFCESVMGDMTYKFKKDPRIRGVYKVLEEEASKSAFEDLQPLTEFLTSASILPTGSDEAVFFEAMEYLDYQLYAISEVELYQHFEFIPVLARHHQRLINYAKKFKSVGELYSGQVQAWVKLQIEAHPNEVEGAPVLEPHPRHLRDLVEAARKLAGELVVRGADQEQIDGIFKDVLE